MPVIRNNPLFRFAKVPQTQEEYKIHFDEIKQYNENKKKEDEEMQRQIAENIQGSDIILDSELKP